MASYAVSYINKPQSVFALHNNENGRMGNKVEILYPLHFALHCSLVQIEIHNWDHDDGWHFC